MRCRSSFSPWVMQYRKGICGCTSDLFVGLTQSAPARTLRAQPMNPGGGFSGRVVEAAERLIALCGREASPDEQIARRNRKRLRKLGEEGGVELSGSVQEQAAIEGQRQRRGRVSPFLGHGLPSTLAKRMPARKPEEIAESGSRNGIFVSTLLSRSRTARRRAAEFSPTSADRGQAARASSQLWFER